MKTRILSENRSPTKGVAGKATQEAHVCLAALESPIGGSGEQKWPDLIPTDPLADLPSAVA
jgi:hypothetical protein